MIDQCEPLPIGLNQYLLIRHPFGRLETVPLGDYVHSLKQGERRYLASQIVWTGSRSYVESIRIQAELEEAEAAEANGCYPPL